MTQPIVPVTGYASIADYELRIGQDIPAEQEPMVQTRLNDTSALVTLYLGAAAEAVEEKHGDVLTALVCHMTYRVASVPAGVRSESVGATSVSYDTAASAQALIPVDTDLLDALIEDAYGAEFRSFGVGQIGVNLGGPDDVWPEGWPDPDADFWVMSGAYYK